MTTSGATLELAKLATSLAIKIDVKPDHSHNMLNHGVKDMPGFEGGSGFCLKIGRRRWIITNFHVVEEAVTADVYKPSTGEIFLALVMEKCPYQDLAILRVEDPKFWAGTLFVDLQDGLPELGEVVYAVGFPVDPGRSPGESESLHFSTGIVRQIAYDNSPTSDNRKNLVINVSGAVNPGNSGGMLLNTEGKLVGVPFMNDEQDYSCISVPVLQVFLDEVIDKGHYSGYYGLKDFHLRLRGQSTAAREYCQSDQGTRIVWSPYAWIENGSTLLKIDGRSLNSEGCVEFRPNEFIEYKAFTENVPESHIFKLEIWQPKQQKVLEFPVKAKQTEWWVPFKQTKKKKPTRYLWLAGYLFFDTNIAGMNELFFQHLPVEEESTGETDEASENPWDSDSESTTEEEPTEEMMDVAYDPDQKAVTLYRSFAQQSTDHNPITGAGLVGSCDGKPMRTLEALQRLARTAKPPYLLIRLTDDRTFCIDKSSLREDSHQVFDCLQITSASHF